MLVNPDFNELDEFIKAIIEVIAKVNGNNPEMRKIIDGVFEIGHFSFGNMIKAQEKEEYPSFFPYFCSYGICDNYQQILKRCPELVEGDRKFAISITPVEKKKQSPEDGWRWHKWGPYIGQHKITTEYLYDEPIIEKVFCFHILELY